MSAVTSPPPPVGDAAPVDPTGHAPAGSHDAGHLPPHLGRVATTLDPRYVDLREPVGFLAAPFARRTWREFGYLWVSLFIAPFAVTYVLFTVSLTAGILVTVVGLVVSGGLILGARGWGGMYRAMARSMLSVDVLPPAPHEPRRGFWRSLWSWLTDGPGWRALTFMLVTFPLALAAYVVTVTFFFVRSEERRVGKECPV